MFGIRDKTVGISVDNAANMSVGAKNLEVLRLPCFAHSMNSAAHKLYSITSFTKWLAKISTIVVWYKRVHLASVVLQEKQKLLGMKEPQMILDVKTRWNSMYLMVQRFAINYPALVAATHDSRLKARIKQDRVDRISDEDLKKCQEFEETMKVLYTSTLAISATNDTPTSGQVLPLFLKLEQHFITLETDSEFVKLIKKAVWGNLQTRYQEEDAKKFLEEATALDPRFKHKMATSNEVWERITHRAAELHKKQYPPVPSRHWTYNVRTLYVQFRFALMDVQCTYIVCTV